MTSKIFAHGAIASLALGTAAMFSPAAAQANFFEQLFGGVATPAPQVAPQAPAYGYDQQMLPDGAPIETQRPRRKKVVLDEKPVLQKPTDLMHDKTLQVGDAVMMKDGLHIYRGPEDAGRHNARQFAPIDDAHGLSKKERATLVAMDTTRNDPLRSGIKPDTLASGRSASVSVPTTQGFKITDPKGRSIRYVGP